MVQNKEPDHFLRIFQGKFLIHLGRDQAASVHEMKEPTPDYVLDTAHRMYQIGGTNELDCKAIQIPCRARLLNSRFSYVILSNNVSYIWHGMAALEPERNFAEHIAPFGDANRLTFILEEGHETAAFWEAIGGQQKYWVFQSRQRFLPRLFQCTVGSGTFTVEEVSPFSQDDLSTDDVFFLDAFNELFIWVGNRCDPKELRKAMVNSERNNDILFDRKYQS